jgi:hypothetical protein
MATQSKKTGAKLVTRKTLGQKLPSNPLDPKAVPVPVRTLDDAPKAIAMASTRAAINAALVVDAFQSNIMGKDVNVGELVVHMDTRCAQVHSGDLTAMESMLVGQATALQTMFTHLAKRAASQEYLKQYTTYMTLALKAQAQSRATISALVDLKYPKQAATFVKQANISSGHQQVNNGAESVQNARAHAGAENFQAAPNKLLEGNHGQRLDIGAQAEASANHQGLEAVGAIHRG